MSALRKSTGRSFQIVGPETRKLRQPKRDSMRGTTRSTDWLSDWLTQKKRTHTGWKLYAHFNNNISRITTAVTTSTATIKLQIDAGPHIQAGSHSFVLIQAGGSIRSFTVFQTMFYMAACNKTSWPAMQVLIHQSSCWIFSQHLLLMRSASTSCSVTISHHVKLMQHSKLSSGVLYAYLYGGATWGMLTGEGR